MGIKLAICAVLPAVWKATEEYTVSFINEIFTVCQNIKGVSETQVIIALEIPGRENWDKLKALSDGRKNLTILRFEAVPKSSAELYLSAFQTALNNAADFILEMDCSGAHEPLEIPMFLQKTVDILVADRSQKVAVFSTRFSKGGHDYFPSKRVWLSKGGTIFAHLLLNMGKQGSNLSDLTSGFEAFSSELLKKMFAMEPPNNWVSVVYGPMHLFQTEARALVCWIAKAEKVTILENPITYGKNFTRKLAPLDYRYLLKAFSAGILLALRGIFINAR